MPLHAWIRVTNARLLESQCLVDYMDVRGKDVTEVTPVLNVNRIAAPTNESRGRQDWDEAFV